MLSKFARELLIVIGTIFCMGEKSVPQSAVYDEVNRKWKSACFLAGKWASFQKPIQSRFRFSTCPTG